MKKKASAEVAVSLSGGEFQFEKRNERGLNLETLIKFDLAITEREVGKAVKRRAENVAVKGFRKGKAPLSLIGPELSYQLGPKVVDGLIAKAVEILGKEELKDWYPIPRFSVEKRYNPFQTEPGESFAFVAYWEKQNEKLEVDLEKIEKKKLNVIFNKESLENAVKVLSQSLIGETAQGRINLEDGDLIFCQRAEVQVDGVTLSDRQIFSAFMGGFNDIPFLSQSQNSPASVLFLCNSELISKECFSALSAVEIVETESGRPDIEVSYRTNLDGSEVDVKVLLKGATVATTKKVKLEDKFEETPAVSTLLGPVCRYLLLCKRIGIWDEEGLKSVIDGLAAHDNINEKLGELYEVFSKDGYRIESDISQVNSATICKGEEVLEPKTLNEVSYGDFLQGALLDLKLMSFGAAQDRFLNELCGAIKKCLADKPIGDSRIATLLNDSLLLNFASQREDIGYACLGLEREQLEQWKGDALLSDYLANYGQESELKVGEEELRSRVFSSIKDLNLQARYDKAELNQKIRSLMTDRNFHRVVVGTLMHEKALDKIAELVGDGYKLSSSVNRDELKDFGEEVNHLLDRSKYLNIAFFAAQSFSKLEKEQGGSEHDHDCEHDGCQDPTHNHGAHSHSHEVEASGSSDAGEEAPAN